jgi:hypothetical protein
VFHADAGRLHGLLDLRSNQRAETLDGGKGSDQVLMVRKLKKP